MSYNITTLYTDDLADKNGKDGNDNDGLFK